MGRKGVSKRKPKQQKSSANGSASTRSGGNAVASLVKDKSAPLIRGGTNPSAGFNKQHKKGK